MQFVAGFIENITFKCIEILLAFAYSFALSLSRSLSAIKAAQQADVCFLAAAISLISKRFASYTPYFT